MGFADPDGDLVQEKMTHDVFHVDKFEGVFVSSLSVHVNVKLYSSS